MTEARGSMERVTKAVFAGLSSYLLAIILLLYMGLLTYKGTLDQAHMSLHAVQNRYFSSLFFEASFFGLVPLYLPGAFLVLALLSVNLICGGLIRIRKRVASAGVIVVHIGILWMLSAGLVEYMFADRGYLTLYEQEQDDEFIDFYEWDMVVGELLEEGRIREHVIPGEQFKHLSPGSKVTFRSQQLPFHLVVLRYFPNATPATSHGDVGVRGFYLRPLPLEQKAENNVAGAHVQIVDDATGEQQPALLWGGSSRRLPMTFRAAGKDWMLSLRHSSYALPFTIRLNKFTKLDHPGITTPSKFSSNVTKIEDGARQDVTISMNKPLRRKGYTVFQTSWGPQEVPNPRRLFSQFEVVSNPADQWPLWSCLVILLGLVFHFGLKLNRYIERCRTEGRMA